LLELGLSKKHTFVCAYWLYLSIAYCDDATVLDTDGAGEIQEPDWAKLLPAGKQQIDFEDLGERLSMAFAEIFNPENNVWPDDKRPSIRQIMSKRF
jgi:hypothetical protein